MGDAVRDIIQEAKKRVLFLLICAFGLAYMMSLTSSSVWVNLPAAASLILFFRYLSLDLDIRKRPVGSENQSVLGQPPPKKTIELPKVFHDKSNWRRKVNSPPVEEAIDHFTRHIISEWVTDLWYSRITPDRDGPEELVQIMNDVLGEISSRAREINLLDLLTRDVITLFCNHLELYRVAQSKIGQQELVKLPVDLRDAKLKLVLAAENSLHPGLFSIEAEHKVLQHLMAGLISFTFKPEDLQCSFFCYTSRELLACAVMRPILNLINPRFINEKIESLVLSSRNKGVKGVIAPGPAQGTVSRSTSSQLASSDEQSSGLELVQLKQENKDLGESSKRNSHITLSTNSRHSSSSIGSEQDVNRDSIPHRSGGEWGHMLDAVSKRKTQVLAPEHLENMWARGRNYVNKESAKEQPRQAAKDQAARAKEQPCQAAKDQAARASNAFNERPTGFLVQDTAVKSEDILKPSLESTGLHSNGNYPTYPITLSNQDIMLKQSDNEDAETDSSFTSEGENSNVMGLDSPGTKIWDGKSKTVSRIRHPLESSESMKRSGKSHVLHPRVSRTSSGRKRHRSSTKKVSMWQEVERSSYLLGDGQDILNGRKCDLREELSDDSEIDSFARTQSGATTSSTSSISASEVSRPSENLMLDDSFLKLRCEVLGANIVKSGSGTFAVYSIAVTDADNNSWSIKRRFRHFSELHRLLKEFPEYNLSLPPKHFLSSGLDASVIQERCILLDIYLKKLLQLPTVSRSIEVWDFLSVDSQTYMFSDSLSIVQTLSVDFDSKSHEKGGKVQSSIDALNDVWSKGEVQGSTKKDYSPKLNSDGLGFAKGSKDQFPPSSSGKYGSMHQGILSSDSKKHGVFYTYTSAKPDNVPIRVVDDLNEASNSTHETISDAAIPTEWVPPNLSAPILDLVDAIFQLQDGGWIRRQAFWVAKQVLQLGMGDAFDDWLIDKIQVLRKGSVVATGIGRLEQILWPDGIFITKHPNRRRPVPQSSPGKEYNPDKDGIENELASERQKEATRAKFVHELIIDKAPAALVSLVGRKEYERCAQDVYLFFQSPVCLKQLSFELLELLLLTAFPELDDVVRKCHEEKEQFGKLEVGIDAS